VRTGGNPADPVLSVLNTETSQSSPDAQQLQTPSSLRLTSNNVGDQSNTVADSHYLRADLGGVGGWLSASQVAECVADFEPGSIELKEILLGPTTSNLPIADVTDVLFKTLRPASDVGNDLIEVASFEE
jgi:hypothetical protein